MRIFNGWRVLSPLETSFKREDTGQFFIMVQEGLLGQEASFATFNAQDFGWEMRVFRELSAEMSSFPCCQVKSSVIPAVQATPAACCVS